ncbi:tyrosine-protein kinase Mer-like isoform X2 [Dysidea avara]|uniref:tyrosine-protein kinase Mer-like isoform X2 n=1 Tax=Dysidea avara TaxID=196820 RepID=UPI0033287C9A
MYHCVTEILLILSFSIHVKSLECISSPNFIPSLCSDHVDNVFNYTTLDNYQQITEVLISTFDKLPFDLRDFCYPTAQMYTCKYFFPPCNEDNNQPVAICEESCDHFLHESVCGDTFVNVSTLLSASNLTLDINSFDNCSSSVYPLYNTSASRNVDCHHFNKIPFKNGTVECSPLPINQVFCRKTFQYTHFSATVVTQLGKITEPIGAIIDNEGIPRNCRPFLAFYQCYADYTPCNATSMKIFSFCENICDAFSQFSSQCLNFVSLSGQLKYYYEQFDCTNPLTFTSTLTLDFYQKSSDEICDAAVDYLGSGSPISGSGLSTGALAGIIIGAVLIVILVVISISAVIIIIRRGKKSIPVMQVIPSQSNHYNGNRDDTTTRSNIELSEFMQSIEEQFSDILVPSEKITKQYLLGKGTFGCVHKGTMILPNESLTPVAIKTIAVVTLSSIKELVSESSVMKKFDHPNVLPLLGVCMDCNDDDVFKIILPFITNGDLRNFLRCNRVQPTITDEFNNNISERMLLMMCLDIAKGMEYLSSKRFVHRDLAARNCMVEENHSIRVADFGLTKDIYTSEYYRGNKHDTLPFKWMAPESITDLCFDEKTDVWSYGVTCWEIFSLGKIPYATVENEHLLVALSTGKRLNKPALCPPQMFNLIKATWLERPSERPSFAEIVNQGCYC